MPPVRALRHAPLGCLLALLFTVPVRAEIDLGSLDIFVQDSPTVGSLFSNDQVTYKIRHIYSGAVMDFRGFYKAVVA